MIYPEGGWWDQLFDELPNVSIHIESGCIYAIEYPSGRETRLDEPRPDDPIQCEIWDYLQGIPDLM